jgi:hypothetical protein
VLAEVDVNPLIARPDGAIAVDALVVPKMRYSPITGRAEPISPAS